MKKGIMRYQRSAQSPAFISLAGLPDRATVSIQRPVAYRMEITVTATGTINSLRLCLPSRRSRG